MGSGNMGPKLAEFAKREYPDSKSDLYAMFIERNREFLAIHGLSALVTMHSWMFLSGYRRLRANLLKDCAISSMAHLGTNGFGSIGGDVVSTAAFVANNAGAPGLAGSYVRLVAEVNELKKSHALRKAALDPSSDNVFWMSGRDFLALPNAPIAYWIGPSLRSAFLDRPAVGTIADSRCGMNTGDNGRFIREWWEVNIADFGPNMGSLDEAHDSGRKWFPYNKGGTARRWYGNQQSVISFDRENYLILAQQGNKLPSRDYYFRSCVSWSKIGAGRPAFRYFPPGFIFDGAGMSAFVDGSELLLQLTSYLNSNAATLALEAIAPTMNIQAGDIADLPAPSDEDASSAAEVASRLIEIHRIDWNSSEISWEFRASPLMSEGASCQSLATSVDALASTWSELSLQSLRLELENDRNHNARFGLTEGLHNERSLKDITLSNNSANRFSLADPADADQFQRTGYVRDLISYAVGCMFGRYSLDNPGLVLANQNESLADYLEKVVSPSFMPDEDNVLPVLSDSWFEDDIVERFREFLKVSFGAEHFEENLRFVEDALGKDIRQYFVQDFYKDHVQRYKKRPIYWLFSSPKGSFNALIYMHRYRPDTVSLVLNDYLHEFQAKLRARRTNVEQVAVSMVSTVKEQAAARKESEQIGKVLLELEEWEQNVLYPLATEQIEIDLDDGVKANYPKFGAALNNKYTGF
ncbi:BREX-1 system adenine-specific DNA-methyltransferase PglX [Arthrobacter sp. IA7]|nr:BREX-1 system adenine-specific DNA-methyltransferase PglX [Arthrobacter ipis]